MIIEVIIVMYSFSPIFDLFNRNVPMVNGKAIAEAADVASAAKVVTINYISY